jgi:lysophospholipase L1-like esterase
MNTTTDAITILAYGDSNTYGQKPDRSGRFDAATRWAGVLQSQLGDHYYVIEEGLGGRTTNLEHPNPNKPSRNGLTYFQACLESHSPLDIIILMLGTNDFKVSYGRSAEDITQALEIYLEDIKKSYEGSSAKQPTIFLVSPPHMNHEAPLFYESMPTPGIYDETSTLKSQQLAGHLEQLAARHHIPFLDAATITQAGDDGVHMTAPSHLELGRAIATIIQQQNT